jgi:hypothetical protein
VTANPGPAAPSGAAFGLHRRTGDLVPLVCGHVRTVAFNDPGAVTAPLWCDECDHVRAQADHPTPAQAYEIAAANLAAARAELDRIRHLAELAELNLAAAEAALAAQETRPGIPAWTRADQAAEDVKHVGEPWPPGNGDPYSARWPERATGAAGTVVP